jgi:hypothetical protein
MLSYNDVVVKFGKVLHICKKMLFTNWSIWEEDPKRWEGFPKIWSQSDGRIVIWQQNFCMGKREESLLHVNFL